MESIDIKGKQYVTVNERIKYFRDNYPEGFITTKIISNEGGRVLMQAVVFPDSKNKDRYFTGFAQEIDGASFINKTSFIENCETSAIGRALGIMGIGIDASVASAEEVQNAMKQQEPKAYWSTYGDEKYFHIKAVSTLGEIPPIPFIEEHAQLGYQYESAMRNLIKTKNATPTCDMLPTNNIKMKWNDICEAMNLWIPEHWHKFKLDGVEVHGLSEVHKVTGKLDDQGIYEGKPCIVDYKKTKTITKQIRDVYFTQMAGYTLFDNANSYLIDPEILVLVTPFSKPIVTDEIKKYQDLFIGKIAEYKKKFNV